MSEYDKISSIQRKPFPIILILNKLRSVANIGNIFRLADALNIAKIYTVDYTATPPHPKLAKTARGTEKVIPCENISDIQTLIQKLKRKNYTIYCIETGENSQKYTEINYQGKIAFIVGNEALGIEQNILDISDKYISLPMLGYKNSINVSNALSAVLYHAIQSYPQK